jgi:hypothetical protein
MQALKINFGCRTQMPVITFSKLSHFSPVVGAAGGQAFKFEAPAPEQAVEAIEIAEMAVATLPLPTCISETCLDLFKKLPVLTFTHMTHFKEESGAAGGKAFQFEDPVPKPALVLTGDACGDLSESTQPVSATLIRNHKQLMAENVVLQKKLDLKSACNNKLTVKCKEQVRYIEAVHKASVSEKDRMHTCTNQMKVEAKEAKKEIVLLSTRIQENEESLNEALSTLSRWDAMTVACKESADELHYNQISELQELVNKSSEDLAAKHEELKTCKATCVKKICTMKENEGKMIKKIISLQEALDACKQQCEDEVEKQNQLTLLLEEQKKNEEARTERASRNSLAIVNMNKYMQQELKKSALLAKGLAIENRDLKVCKEVVAEQLRIQANLAGTLDTENKELKACKDQVSGELEELKSRDECIICFGSGSRSTMFLPCGHVTHCKTCSGEFVPLCLPCM